MLLGIVQHWFLLFGVLICLAVVLDVAPATLLVPVPLVVVEVVVAVLLVMVVEAVVDVLVVVAHGCVLIVTRRTTLLIVVGIFMIVPLPIRLDFPLKSLLHLIPLLGLCLF